MLQAASRHNPSMLKYLVIQTAMLPDFAFKRKLIPFRHKYDFSMRGFLMISLVLLTALTAGAQQTTFTRADTLRGTITPPRAWWDVKEYDLHVKLEMGDSSLTGFNAITYRVLKVDSLMQIDLQTPMEIDSIVQDKQSLDYVREGNAIFVKTKAKQLKR